MYIDHDFKIRTFFLIMKVSYADKGYCNQGCPGAQFKDIDISIPKLTYGDNRVERVRKIITGI
jgi:hypothetical protein